jgi:hypothetical protein
MRATSWLSVRKFGLNPLQLRPLNFKSSAICWAPLRAESTTLIVLPVSGKRGLLGLNLPVSQRTILREWIELEGTTLESPGPTLSFAFDSSQADHDQRGLELQSTPMPRHNLSRTMRDA